MTIAKLNIDDINTDKNFLIIKAELAQLTAVYNLVHRTIQEIYPKYYTNEVVNFFLELHSLNAIAEEIGKGMVYALVLGEDVVGTGTIQDNHITRVYVLPEYRGKGIGKSLMDYLENIVTKNHDEVWVDASLPAGGFYQHLGYVTREHQEYPLENGKILAYEVMCKMV